MFRSKKVALAVAGVLGGLGFAESARAVTNTWKAAPTSADWNTAANWTSAVPNAIGDTAVFNTAVGGGFNPITLSATTTLQNLQFAAGAGAYTIGTNGGLGLVLRGTGASNTPSYVNAISMASGVTNSEVVAAPISFSAPSSTAIGYVFKNDSTTSGATLTISGAITANTATNRATSLSLDGSANGTVSGVITSTLASGGVANLVLKKEGTGTWILSGANVLTGGNMTSTSGTLGIQVNAGVLSAQNNAALGGTNAGTANTLNTWINNGGTLELSNNITLNNEVVLNLNNGGTVQSKGSTTSNGRVNLSAAAAVSATIATVNAADVFTLGNGANDLNGGASDTVIHIAGPGTVVNAQSSTGYLGSFAIDAGALRNGSSTNGLGVAGVVTFGNGSTGKLQLGNNLTLNSLTTNNATPTAGTVEASAATPTLTLAVASSNTFGGALQNGAGTLAVTKSGTGTLVLSGTSTYTGATSLTAGTTKVNGTLGNTAVTVNSGATLGGTGTINGSVNVANGGILAPGNSVGTNTIANLTLNSSSILDFEFNGTNNDKTIVSASNGLTLNGGTFHLYNENAVSTYNTPGDYQLIQYSGSIGGTGLDSTWTTASVSNPHILNLASGYKYSFNTTFASGWISLKIEQAATIGTWTNTAADGMWGSATNWSGGTPSVASDSAKFLGAGAPQTVTLDTNRTVGGVEFDGASPYTLAQGAGGTLFLDNLGAGASITTGNTTASTHSISAPISFTDTVTLINVTSSDALTLSGALSGVGGLIKSGPGTTSITGTSNTFGGSVSINQGTLQFSGSGSLGSGTALNLGSAINSGTLKYASGNTDDVSTRTITINAGGGVVNTNGNNVTFANAIGNAGAGSLTKSGLGKLTLGGSNTYTGSTTVNGGTLSISANNNLGPDATGAAITLATGGTLETTATFALDNAGANNRQVNVSGGTISPASGTTLTISGVIAGSSGLLVNGAGKVSLTGSSNTYTGGTSVASATLGLDTAVNNSTGGIPLSSGTITLVNSTLTSNMGSGNTLIYDATNPISVPSGSVSSISTPNRFRLNAAVSGSGTLGMAINTNVSRADFQNDFSGFTGNLNITGTGGIRLGIVALGSGQPNFNSNGMGNLTLSLDGATIVPTTNSGGNTILIGALTSTGSTGTLGGGTAGAPTYSIGAKNSNTTFGGVIQANANLTKTGTGTLTLTGANTYVNTTISGGILQVGAGGTTGDLGTGGVVNNATLSINRSNAYSNASAMSGTGALTHDGTGTTTLSGPLSYGGNTTVNAGSLIITGSQSGKASNKNFIARDTDGFGNGVEISLTRTPGAGGTYNGYGSTEIGGLASAADLKQGLNASGSDNAITMQWRLADDSNLVSDVVSLTGMINSTGTQTDPYALQVAYDQTSVGANEAQYAADGKLALVWLDGNGFYQNAVAANIGSGTAIANYQGAYTAFASANGITDANVGNFLGSWGVDTTNNVAWAILNHNSQFAVAVPEPTVVGLMSVGLVGGLNLRRRRSSRTMQSN